MYYFKWNLVRRDWAKASDLKKLAQTAGAGSISLIIGMESWELKQEYEGIGLSPTVEFGAVKAPTLEGTEIWIVAASFYSELDALAGFGKPSIPLLRFQAALLLEIAVENPLKGSLLNLSLCSTAPQEKKESFLKTGVSLISSKLPIESGSQTEALILQRAQEEGRLLFLSD